MTIASLEKDIILLAIFLLAGFAIRELVKPLQKLYIPASVIGGTLALICGHQVLNLVQIPESFGQMSGVLINLVMTASIFGVQINRKRIRGFLDYAVMLLITYGLQIAVGVALGLGLQKLWPGLPKGWGAMGVFAFWGGHGNSGAAGAVFEEAGVADNLGMGMILSTIGLIVAIVVGMILVNWGVRKGYAKNMSDDPAAEPVNKGVLPEDQQKSIGSEKVSAIAINSIALQLAFLCLCMFVGYNLVGLLATPVPALSKIPNMARGMLGAAIVWPIMLKTKLSGYADKRTVSTISGFCLELIVLSAIATLRLDLVTEYFMPILIYSAVIVVLMVLIVPFFTRKICRYDWFEKMLLLFGQGTGTTSTGMALVRCVDPSLKSSAPDGNGVGGVIILPITGTFPAILPLVIMGAGGEMAAIGIGLAIGIGAMIIGRIFFWGSPAD